MSQYWVIRAMEYKQCLSVGIGNTDILDEWVSAAKNSNAESYSCEYLPNLIIDIHTHRNANLGAS